MPTTPTSSQRVTIQAHDGGRLPAYLALPPGGRGPGIVLMQEIFGVNGYMRGVADWYAARGFAVVCPDLFWRQEPGVELTDRTEQEWQRAIGYMKGMDERLAIEDCAAAMVFLKTHSACTGVVGGVGFCMGGRLAYLLAARQRPDCCVGYYGVGIERSLGESKEIAVPLMLHMAGKDAHCPPAAQAAIREQIGSNPQVTIHHYQDLDHAFARPGGRNFDAAAAELADLRSLEFLIRHLAAAGTDLARLWEEHISCEFDSRDTERTLSTMVPDAYVNHIPVMTGGMGHAQLREFYSKRFIPRMPPDTQMTAISRTIGSDQLVDEMVFSFTHTVEMDWMLPGIAPTGSSVRVPLVVIVRFREGKLAHEHIYWDQACVLAQIGLIPGEGLPVAGRESAEKALEPGRPFNQLMERPGGRRG